MTSRRSLIGFIVLAVVLAYLAAKGVSRYLEKPVDTKTILVVSKEPVAMGEALTPEKLKLTEWSDNRPPPGYFKSVEEVSGRVAAQSIDENVPILESMLLALKPESRWGLSESIPSGHRAITLAVDGASALSGGIASGDWVDVIASSALPRDSSHRIARVLVKAARVHSISERGEGRTKAVTLVVRTDEAKALAASDGAVLRLVARNREADQQEYGREVLFSAIMGPHSLSEFGRRKEVRDRSYDERVPTGMRAVTIAVSGMDGICGFLRQGNLVDVVGVHPFIEVRPHQGRNLPGQELMVAGEQTYSKIILQNMEVLAVADDVEAGKGLDAGPRMTNMGARISGDAYCDGAACADGPTDNGEPSRTGEGSFSKSAKLVTLLATPAQAEKLALLSVSSDLKLIVRNYGDRDVAPTDGGSSRETLYGAEEERHRYVTIYRGRSKESQMFPVVEPRASSIIVEPGP